MKNLLKAKLDSKSLEKETVVELLKSFINIYLSGALSDQIIQNLNLQLQDILNSSYIAKDQNIVIQLLDHLKASLTANPQNINLYKPICYIMQITISCSCTNNQSYNEILPRQILIADQIIELIKGFLLNINDLDLLIRM
jgi:hypothetical protein